MFKFPQLRTGAAPEGLNPNDLREESLRKVGFEFSSNQMDDAYLFSRMGGWNVTFRASVIRICFFKLLGTGIAAAFVAISPHVGAYTAWSCTMCAAVNLVACGHYWYLWQTRLQTYRGAKYDKWTANVGRVPAEDKALLAAETEHDKSVIFFQEVTCDGLRYATLLAHCFALSLAHALFCLMFRSHSDWLCTLVLMTLDLGHLREYLWLASAGVVPPMPLSKEWLASLQATMIFFATIWRFYTNEVRSVRQPDGTHLPPSLLTAVLGWGSFFVSSGLFGVIVWGLLAGLPNEAARAGFATHMNADVICLQVLVLVWCGYPAVAMLSRLGHWGLPGSYYSATISTFKDIAYAGLDVTSKGGLAIFFVLKASWLSGETEEALVIAGRAALNISS